MSNDKKWSFGRIWRFGTFSHTRRIYNLLFLIVSPVITSILVTPGLKATWKRPDDTWRLFGHFEVILTDRLTQGWNPVTCWFFMTLLYFTNLHINKKVSKRAHKLQKRGHNQVLFVMCDVFCVMCHVWCGMSEMFYMWCVMLVVWCFVCDVWCILYNDIAL